MISARIGIIIQARMGSTRLPGKILMQVGNKMLLEHILFRLTLLHNTVKTIIATSDSILDDQVELFCSSHNVECFRGSEHNVLDRYYKCATKYNFEHIIRLTGDNPFPDVEEISNLIDLHLSGSLDYTNSFNNLPIGVGAEIFTYEALVKSWHEGNAPHHIEHVNEYMLEHPEIFKTSTLSIIKEKNRPDVRLTIDTKDDFAKSCYIVDNCKTEYISTVQAIELAAKFAHRTTSVC